MQRICREHDILVVDEVITGFGRTGHMFATERYGLQPDLITFANGVTSGHAPLGDRCGRVDHGDLVSQGAIAALACPGQLPPPPPVTG